MYLEEQAKSLTKRVDEEQLSTELKLSIFEINKVFFKARQSVLYDTKGEEIPPAYVHARAIELYINVFNERKKDSPEKAELDLIGYGEKVTSITQKLDLRVPFSITEILVAQEYCADILRKLTEYMHKK